MSAQNRPDVTNNPEQPNHPIVLCFVTEKGHEVGKSTLKEVEMAPVGTDIGVSLASQLPSQMSDLMQGVLTTIHAEGLVPIWSYDRLEIEVSSAMLMSGNQPAGTPYELKIPVRPSDEPSKGSQVPPSEEIMEPAVDVASSETSSPSPGENMVPAETPNEEATYSPPSFGK